MTAVPRIASNGNIACQKWLDFGLVRWRGRTGTGRSSGRSKNREKETVAFHTRLAITRSGVLRDARTRIGP